MTSLVSPSKLERWRPQLLVALLGLLYLILLQPAGSNVAKTFFVAHLGLFIVWQPFVEGGRQLSARALFLVAVVVTLATIVLNVHLLMLWIMVLTGIVGGKVLFSGALGTRWFYLLALGFLVLSLLLLATPLAFREAQLPQAITVLAQFGLPIILLIMAFLPYQDSHAHAAEIVDFVNSAFIFLLLAVLVLGSLASMQLFKSNYAEALLNTLIILGCVLLILGWAWNPHAGFAGLGDFFSRYLMSVGLPAEQWLQALTDRSTQEDDPEQFIALGCRDLAQRLYWLGGISWTTATNAGNEGETRGNATSFQHQGVRVTAYTRFPLSPSLAWHFQLLIQLLGEFHADKQRAGQLKALSYLQAVHETGARLTHDVKNLLQSLQTLCHAAEEPGADESPEFRALLRRQLPAIATRLETTLGKLKAPQNEAAAPTPALDWWAAVIQRHAAEPWIRFELEASTELFREITLPESAFSSVLENLISNAADKRSGDPDVQLVVSLLTEKQQLQLRVCDNGAPLPDELAQRLLSEPVSSQNGLGIGLYQAAQLASQAGYQLKLSENRIGRVCFTLTPN